MPLHLAQDSALPPTHPVWTNRQIECVIEQSLKGQTSNRTTSLWSGPFCRKFDRFNSNIAATAMQIPSSKHYTVSWTAVTNVILGRLCSRSPCLPIYIALSLPVSTYFYTLTRNKLFARAADTQLIQPLTWNTPFVIIFENQTKYNDNIIVVRLWSYCRSMKQKRNPYNYRNWEVYFQEKPRK